MPYNTMNLNTFKYVEPVSQHDIDAQDWQRCSGDESFLVMTSQIPRAYRAWSTSDMRGLFTHGFVPPEVLSCFLNTITYRLQKAYILEGHRDSDHSRCLHLTGILFAKTNIWTSNEHLKESETACAWPAAGSGSQSRGKAQGPGIWHYEPGGIMRTEESRSR